MNALSLRAMHPAGPGLAPGHPRHGRGNAAIAMNAGRHPTTTACRTTAGRACAFSLPIFEGLTLWDLSTATASRPSGGLAERWGTGEKRQETWISICGAA